VFAIVVGLNAIAALLALFVIKPMRRAFILGGEAAMASGTQDAKAA
jgi:OFA family oxalate/formate antiporter-like MFS transporter